LRLAEETITPDDAVVATVNVTNTGGRRGEDVVQLYVGARGSTVERAPRELKSFDKIELAPSETRTVRFAVPATELAYYDATDGWTIEPGEYEVIVGRHSLDEEAQRAQLLIR
jgi:beta-glucosidase